MQGDSTSNGRERSGSCQVNAFDEVTVDQVITELNSDDVLLGRGAGPNEHSGNVRYRKIVKDHQPEYLATINRSIKDKVAHKVIISMKADGGRFLRRLGKDRARTLGFVRRDAFLMAEPKIVLEKTKQALRFQARNKVSPKGTDKKREIVKNDEILSTQKSTDSNEALKHRSVAADDATLQNASSLIMEQKVSSQPVKGSRNGQKTINHAFSSASHPIHRGPQCVSISTAASNILLQLQLADQLRRDQEESPGIYARASPTPALELLDFQQMGSPYSTPTVLAASIQAMSQNNILHLPLRTDVGLQNALGLGNCLPGILSSNPTLSSRRTDQQNGNIGISPVLYSLLRNLQGRVPIPETSST